jgi:C1A family cysteine protease
MKEYKLNVRKSPVDPRDYKVKLFLAKPVELPIVVDYRKDALPIRDQGDQGSCAAMAGAAMKEWQERMDSGLTEYFSPQFIYNNREDPDEEGMNMRDLMGILKDHGDCQESVFLYGDLSKPPERAYELAAYFKIKGFAAVESAEELKAALYQYGPCIIAVPVYNYTERMWKQKSGEKLLGGHALAVYGYNEQGFIIRNSWSDDWGQDGYCIMSFADFGLAWEYWSTIDATSPKPEPKPKKKWFKWWMVVLGLFIVGIVLLLIRII